MVKSPPSFTTLSTLMLWVTSSTFICSQRQSTHYFVSVSSFALFLFTIFWPATQGTFSTVPLSVFIPLFSAFLPTVDDALTLPIWPHQYLASFSSTAISICTSMRSLNPRISLLDDYLLALSTSFEVQFTFHLSRIWACVNLRSLIYTLWDF